MRILGIESSCDETAVALVDAEGDRLSVVKNLVSSQIDLHAVYGGVVPEVAAREHVTAIFPLLHQAGIAPDGSGIDAIAVTRGPGLVAALRVGAELAKALAWLWNKPLVGVNHLEGHLYSVWLNQTEKSEIRNPKFEMPRFPALALLVSGGHTELILLRDHEQYELLGMTRDDAAGEAFDKVAKLLGLPYPGGPQIAKQAEQGNPFAIDFPRPMFDSGDLDFSFSGLKTAVSVYLKKQTIAPVADVCASFQAAVVDVLTQKTLQAAQAHGPASVILSGGVSANVSLRESLGRAIQETMPDVTYHVPALKYTGDNAAMIAAAGYFRLRQGDTMDPLTMGADPNLRLAE